MARADGRQLLARSQIENGSLTERGGVEYTSGSSTWRTAIGRALRAFQGRRQRGRRSVWSVMVPIVALLAGFLFTVSARTAAGTALRDDRTPQLSSLIADRNRQIEELQHQESGLRKQVDDQTNVAGGSDTDIANAQKRGDAQKSAAGLATVHGGGLTVRLDDAPAHADGSRPAGASPDDLVVHQQDVQAVVNALWAGGAEALSIMGIRVISTSAVHCVGNTLLLNGRVYSPPFVITAIGDPTALRAALDASEGVRLFQEAASEFGLRYQVKVEVDVTVPAFDGSTALQYAQPAD
jgi:uncharacterized protein YlxW (UPF0749 family)